MKIFASLLLVVLISTYSNAQLKIAVDREAATFFKSKSAVGLAVGVYQKGKANTFFYGTTDKEKSVKPTGNSIFSIASLSKTFSGLLLAYAVNEKKIDLNDDVRKYVGDGYPNLEYGGQPIRINHLISHLSRLPAHLSDRAELPGYSKKDFFDDLHNIKLDTIPGIRFMYSNAAVELLGYILEDVYKISLEELLNQKITGPLKMKNTNLIVPVSKNKLKTKGYNEDGMLNPQTYDHLLGAGGFKSTVDDLLKYVVFQMNETNEAVKLSHKEIWGFDMGEGKHYSFAMAWQIVTDSTGERKISQDGNVPSYSSVIIFSPKNQTAIVVLSNSIMMKEAGELANKIYESL